MLVNKECYPTYKLEIWDFEKCIWDNVRSFYDYRHAIQFYKCYVKEHPTATFRLIKVINYHEYIF